jgi:plastocyanin
MRITVLLVVLLLPCLNALAGMLSGSVKATGKSAVVLEAVPAKTFSAPSQTAAMDQRGMQFTYTLLVIQQGTTVVFSNDDSVAHNVFWPNISGNKKLVITSAPLLKAKT